MIGTGKTQLIAGMLRELPPAEFISIGINLNYYSTATVLLGSLEAPLQKLGLFPPNGIVPARKIGLFLQNLELFLQKLGSIL